MRVKELLLDDADPNSVNNDLESALHKALDPVGASDGLRVKS